MTKQRFKVSSLVWVFLACLMLWTILVAVAHGQNLENKSGATKSGVRGLLKEPTTTFLIDSTLVRIVNYAQMTTMLALKEKTKIRQDTIVTSPARVSYYLANTQDAADTVMAGGGVAMVIQKDATAIGGKEHALAYIPYDMVGRTLADGAPSFYTIVNRQIILGQSPYGGDSLILFYNVVPRTLDNDTVSLTTAKEDQPAVIYMACMLAALGDHQYQGAQLYWNLWQAHTGFKGYPQQIPDKGSVPSQ